MNKICCFTFNAFISGDFPSVYKHQFHLAKYFQHKGDKWLADHFFNQCLATSFKVEGDNGRHAAQGHCNVGLSLEERGELHNTMKYN